MNESAARVLGALRQAAPGALSGASLSAGLGVSRAQVWKHVEALRAAGYRIAGEPGGGYRFCAAPDRLFSHLAMSENNDKGEGTAWLEHVSDADYAKPPAPDR